MSSRLSSAVSISECLRIAEKAVTSTRVKHWPSPGVAKASEGDGHLQPLGRDVAHAGLGKQIRHNVLIEAGLQGGKVREVGEQVMFMAANDGVNQPLKTSLVLATAVLAAL